MTRTPPPDTPPRPVRTGLRHPVETIRGRSERARTRRLFDASVDYANGWDVDAAAGNPGPTRDEIRFAGVLAGGLSPVHRAARND